MQRDLASLAGEGSIFGGSAAAKLERLQAELRPLSCRYDVVVANPPYMGSSNMNKWLAAWVKSKHKEAYRDLCTCFIKRGMSLAEDGGYEALITSDTCMYISSFEQMRKMVIDRTTIVTFIDTRGTNAHPDVFDANAGWMLWNHHSENVLGAYFKLNHPIAEKGERLLEALADPGCGWFYRADADRFGAIPGSPIAYWASDKLYASFLEGVPLQNLSAPRKGLGTGNKDLFMRFWWEPSLSNVCFNARNHKDAIESSCRWFPHNKGGEYRKWYGNCDYVVDWSDGGAAIKSYTNSQGQLAARPQNTDCYFKQCITWSKISSGKLAFRFKEEGDIFNEVAPALFGEKALLIRLEAFLNSSVCDAVAAVLSPTLDFQVGQVASYPILEGVLENNRASGIVELNTGLSRQDWNSFEESWSFCRHPLV